MPSGPNVLNADLDRVYFDGHDFSRIRLRDFLSALARMVQKRDATMVRVSAYPVRTPRREAGEARREIDAGGNHASDSSARHC